MNKIVVHVQHNVFSLRAPPAPQNPRMKEKHERARKVYKTTTMRRRESKMSKTWRQWKVMKVMNMSSNLNNFLLRSRPNHYGNCRPTTNINQVILLRRETKERPSFNRTVMECEFRLLSWWQLTNGGGQPSPQMPPSLLCLRSEHFCSERRRKKEGKETERAIRSARWLGSRALCFRQRWTLPIWEATVKLLLHRGEKCPEIN